MSYPPFTNQKVEEVYEFLQKYMIKNQVRYLTADEGAEILSKNKVLPNNIGPKQGFYFRQMLRDGRDGKINLMKGVSQEKPGARWVIKRISKME